MKVFWLRRELILCISISIVLTCSLLIIRRMNSTSSSVDTSNTQPDKTTIIQELVATGVIVKPQVEIITKVELIPEVKTDKPDTVINNTLSSIYAQINSQSSQLDCGFPRLVLVIQVHDRLHYLEQLLQSLKENEQIQHTLVITSHDLYVPEVHKLVTSVFYTRVIPIYYPYSQQIYKETFPGNDPKDCTKSIQREEALRIKCNNADTPDQYGNYREAKFTAIKHHWFWKIVTVFDKLKCLSDYSGQVIFLEEDHYTSPDFITTALRLEELRDEQCPECDFINMGVYKPKSVEKMHARNVEMYEWIAGDHNMGFGMDRRIWEKIKDCAGYLCSFDDYNWDWSLQAVGMFCLKKKFIVLSLTIPRIFHLGTCGVHQKSGECKPEQQAGLVKKSFLGPEYMNDDKLELVGPTDRLKTGRMPNPRGFGGWGDKRDHNLCIRYLRDGFPISKIDILK
ncbi:Alpha-1,6-mannosyl-glycoprotein 2-beta-N-acetylglucosaminyltransferase-like isoform X2 [Oopsacas minuta]|uniref:Alpha-1,6-mannosyl-glycoprotein 2-beta-N-acetylglucosaminyltransferase n=1 Tax=Oopsacas minuta TaxID=111878 RepID=A0AAV7JVD0_9METZ|nr:Alpha-1,6-mannosyl-glycoprotein 2-beta-N-acetylglucosaminyltransferase-like isoform X2 [Oopsacas minuta]